MSEFKIVQPEKVYAEPPVEETPEPVVEKVEETKPNPAVGQKTTTLNPKSGMALAMAKYLDVEEAEEVKEVEKPEVKEEIKEEQPTEKVVEDIKQSTESKEEEISKVEKQEEESEYKKDLENLSEDFFNNYEKVREKYKLPALETLKDMLVEGDPNVILKKWQESDLTKQLEEKHGLLEGEFEYDPSEASIVGTPSYDWDEMTNSKRSEVFGSYKKRQAQDAVNSQKVLDQQQKDIEWLASNHFESVETVQEKMNGLNDIVMKVSTGEIDAAEHPMGLRSIVRGAYFEELKNAAVSEAIEDLKQQFAKHQLFLPNKEMPTDASNVSSKVSTEGNAESFTKEQRKFSPMFNSMNYELNRSK